LAALTWAGTRQRIQAAQPFKHRRQLPAPQPRKATSKETRSDSTSQTFSIAKTSDDPTLQYCFAKKPPNVRVQMARAVTRNPRRTKLVEKGAIQRSPATTS
jgi:hypothetical protein